MNIILDDTRAKPALYPFTAIRHPADIRFGIQTLREKWSQFENVRLFDSLALYQAAFPRDAPPAILVDAAAVPDASWIEQLSTQRDAGISPPEAQPERVLRYPWEIFQYNDQPLRADFEVLCVGRNTAAVSATNKVANEAGIFIEAGAVVEHCILNAGNGPIYVGRNALLMEGCMLRGPVAICEGSVVKMGTAIYGATTIGPYCSVGGEIKNSVIFGFSNKAHHGYLGDSVIGEWCNLGAGTTNSNVKNTAGEVKAWYHPGKSFVSVGQKCGLLMGDYSRAAINTSFNTGTVTGVSCNIFTPGFPPRYVPDFTWGVDDYEHGKALRDIANWKALKGRTFTEAEQDALTTFYRTINKEDEKANSGS